MADPRDGVEVNKDRPTNTVPPVQLPEDVEVKEKVYHTRYPGSNFIMPDGKVINFNGAGHLKTTSKNVQTQLDKIADKPGSPIYTTEVFVPPPTESVPTNEIATRAAQVIEQLRKQQELAASGGTAGV